MPSPRLELRTLAGYRHQPRLRHIYEQQDRRSSRINGAQRDAGGVLYYQNVILFQATLIRSTTFSNSQTVILCTSRVPNVTHIERGVQTTETAAMHDRNSSTTANVPIFMKFTTPRQHYVEIFRTDLRQNRTRNMKNRVQNHLRP